jgi:GT2 family glycosyltransferase
MDFPNFLSTPKRLTPINSWHEHIPFAMFLVEILRPEIFVELGTHLGDSYCAFCQAVQELNLSTACFAVDTWKGDEHSGLYGPEVLQDLRAHHDPLYGSFSRLIESTFDEALPQFADGTVTLLHIDGCHTYGAAKHDFESWLPKMGPGGVVLIHDINVREREFGVWRFWSELKPQYPHFEFLHSHGLGVLAVGKDYPAALGEFFEASGEVAVELRNSFFRIGRQVAERAASAELHHNQVRQIAELHQAISLKDERISMQSQVIAERDRKIAAMIQTIVERDRKIAHINQLLIDARKELSSLQAAKAQSFAHAEQLQQQLNAARQTLSMVQGSMSWRATGILRAAFAAHPRARQWTRRLVRMVWWTVTLQLGTRLRERRRLFKRRRTITASPLFDARWYLEHYQDVAVGGCDPALHYALFGASEQRNPGPRFDAAWYLKRYSDVASAGVNPLVHYVEHGAAEGRETREVSDLLPGRAASPTAAFAQGDSGAMQTKEAWDLRGRDSLQKLLSRKETLCFPAFKDPDLSILLLFCNNAHLSLLCLESLLTNSDVSYEVVIVDNGSTDETPQLLERIQGATIVRNQENLRFIEGCRQAAEHSRGRYLCFFNNDALLLPNSLSAALRNFEEDPTVGAVGGKILLADGRLQEAGSLLWSDGSALGYGRGDNPDRPEYQFRREVDYCSGAFLFTPRQLFHELGAFDPYFYPAYYEDTDYCMRVWQKGLKVVYEPRAAIRHYESAWWKNEAAQALMTTNCKKFLDKWQGMLSLHLPSSPKNVNAARISPHSKGLRIAYIEDRIPHLHLGSGYPRSNRILRHLVQEGHKVTCVAFTFPLDGDEYSDIPRDVELFDGMHERERLFKDYLPNCDIIWISRPHNMAAFLESMHTHGGNGFRAKLIYDAEAIYADRDLIRARISSQGVSPSLMRAWVAREMALAKAADSVVVVSDRDRDAFESAGAANVHVIGHQIEPMSTLAPFEERKTILFVGAMHGADNPNADSMRYFCEKTWPRVRSETGADLVIAGFGTEGFSRDVKGSGIQILGKVDNLTDLYEQARVFVVPTRYAAGIPFKAHEAASRGVPMVVSTIIGEQLGWQHERDCLIAEGPSEFADVCCRLYRDKDLWERLRANALERVRIELCESAFSQELMAVLGEAPGTRVAPSASRISNSRDASAESHEAAI